MLVQASIGPAWRFFKENAGYATPPGRAACALTLARAEAKLRAGIEAGTLRVLWLPDESPYDCDIPGYVPETVEGCVIERRCPSCGCGWKHATGLWGIADATDDYRRVVEAELACELD